MRIFGLKMYCEPLTCRKSNQFLTDKFHIKREDKYEKYLAEGKVYGLERYFRYCAWNEDYSKETKVYVVKTYFTKEVVCYFALKAGIVSSNFKEQDILREKNALVNGTKLVPSTIAGIELSHFAVNDNYREKHNGVKGLGEYIYPKFIYPIIEKTSSLIGSKIVYLYAADDSSKKLTNYYEGLHFSTIKDADDLKPVTSYYDDNCVFMFKLL